MLLAEDPAGFCARADFLQKLVGPALGGVASPPVLWVAASGMKNLTEPGPDLPLWWAGGAWHQFNESKAFGAAYIPRKFEPAWRCGSVLSHLSPSSIEAGPGEVVAPPGGSDVMQVMRVLLCQRGDKLWSKPLTGGEWRECPYRLHLDVRRVKALELLGGRRYLFLFQEVQGIPSGLDTVLMHDLCRNEWRPPTAARATAAGHQEEVNWQTMNGPRSTAPLKAWVLEASMDYVVLMAPVCRDGFQRVPEKDNYTALYFIGCRGEEVIHHLPCLVHKLTVQRYDRYMLLVKDSGDELLDFAEYPADYVDTCGWLLDAEDWAAGPLPVLLPSDNAAWGYGTWSMVIARGALEDKPDLRLDMAPRIYLLEDDADLRIWTTRRIDDLNAGLQPPTFESRSQFHHLIHFPMEPDEVGPRCLGGNWSLWAPDLQFAARINRGKIWYWRCDVVYEDSLTLLKVA